MLELKYKKIHKDVRGILSQEHKGDAGFDLCSSQDVILAPGEPVKIPTGIILEIEPGYACLIWDKSSMGARGIKVLGGVVDSYYRGEIFVCLINLTNSEIKIEKNKRIAQILIQKIENPILKESSDLSEGYVV